MGAREFFGALRRRVFLAGIAAALIPGMSVAARAQPCNGTRRIGLLMAGSGNRAEAYVASFVESLGALGWHEGGNLQIELRWGRGEKAAYERYAAELVALGPDLIVGQFTPPGEALRRQTSAIPIVFVFVADPLGHGFVKSLARPGGNITGFASLDPSMAGKMLQILTQITPPVARVAVLYNPATATLADQQLRIIEEAARPLAVAVQAAPARDDAEIEAMMAGLASEGRGSVLVLGGDISAGIHLEAIVAAAAHHRVPAVYSSRTFTSRGGLMSYGFHTDDLFSRAAAYVDRILKGANPGDLPVQYPTRFELVLNQKTAAALGVTFASSLLAGADEVIE